MKGIILAGGTGSRLRPVTYGVCKQLLPIYDKPMIYYPLSVLMLGGIREILLITTPSDHQHFLNLLGDGSHLGVNITYAIQREPKGIAHALHIGKNFIDNDEVCLILGDNIFWGQGFSEILKTAIKNNDGATIFCYHVPRPEQFGVAQIDEHGNAIKLHEKPKDRISNWAITGLYIYDPSCVDKAVNLNPSERGELEITDVNNLFLSEKRLKTVKLGRGFAWMDTGTHSSLIQAGMFIETIERVHGFKIACLEEISFMNGWKSSQEILKKIEDETSTYYEYLRALLA